MPKKTIQVKNIQVSLISRSHDDYISLTDIARYKNRQNTGLVISHWLSTKFTVEFIGLWEQMHNKKFNLTEFSKIKNEVGSHGFVLSAKQWIKQTHSVGLISSPGRYGGTFAHKDIAFEFASWISPEFKLYLIKEFHRLKKLEAKTYKLDWNVKRMPTNLYLTCLNPIPLVVYCHQAFSVSTTR